MITSDRIYGDVHVANPLIEELINSGPLQRLKGISQDGATHYILKNLNGNRFEHSFGAWYLSHRLNRPIEEQIACLIHDIPHTAFSHVIDFVMNDTNQEYHDNFLEDVLKSSNIPNILLKYDVDINDVLNKDSFPLLNNRTPELSFDRWDYFMRDANMVGILPVDRIENIIASVKVESEKMYFTSKELAEELCTISLSVCEDVYIHPAAHGSWFLLANAIKRALELKILDLNDLKEDDQHVLNSLQRTNDKEINRYLKSLNSKTEFVYSEVKDSDFHGPNKIRYIDPMVKFDQSLIPISRLVKGLPERIDALRQKAKYIAVKQL